MPERLHPSHLSMEELQKCAVAVRKEKEPQQSDTSPLRTGLFRHSQQRRMLPVYGHRDAIISALEKHQVIVMCGETGSGKTTQVRPGHLLPPR